MKGDKANKKLYHIVCFAFAFLSFTTYLFAKPPAALGRIAISEDGNYHDTDDIDSAAVSVAEIIETENVARLVYYGYCDHYWLSLSTREQWMHDSVEQTALMFGGLPNAKFFNVRASHSQAVAALTAEMNVSTGNNPLVVLEEGPAQVIGEALNASKKRARPYVTIMSHSKWNDDHAVSAGASEGLAAPRYAFNQFAGMGAAVVHIEDQNSGLNRPFREFYWMRDSADTKLQWLWERGQLAAKSTYDCSDAGLTYYALTGDDSATPAKLQILLNR